VFSVVPAVQHLAREFRDAVSEDANTLAIVKIVFNLRKQNGQQIS
jgi:hypothetical protein